MAHLPNRIVIYTKDVMNITGMKERAARNLMARIRRKLNKPEGAFICLHEFCAFTGLAPEHVQQFLS